jgi:hypothetical protein
MAQPLFHTITQTADAEPFSAQLVFGRHPREKGQRLRRLKWYRQVLVGDANRIKPHGLCESGSLGGLLPETPHQCYYGISSVLLQATRHAMPSGIEPWSRQGYTRILAHCRRRLQGTPKRSPPHLIPRPARDKYHGGGLTLEKAHRRRGKAVGCDAGYG